MMRACACLLLLAACTGEEEQSWSVPYVHATVPWIASADGDWYLVDTGTPRTQLLPAAAGRPEGFAGEVQVAGLELAGLHDDEPLLVSDDLPAPLRAALATGEIEGPGGVLGGDLLRKVPMAFDRDGGLLVFGSDARALLAASEPVPVVLRGGGGSCFDDGLCFEATPSRLIAPIEIAGAPIDALVDTASTYLTLPASVFDRLLAAHPGTRVATVETPTEQMRVARLPLRWGDVERQVSVVAVDGLGPALARLHLETGHQVEALLGHSFLGQFLVAVDYQEPRIGLLDRPAAAVGSDFVGIGLRIVPDGDCFRPRSLVRGGPAARAGVTLDSCILGVDGTSPQGDGAAGAARHLDRLKVGDRVLFAWFEGAGEVRAELVAEDWLGE